MIIQSKKVYLEGEFFPLQLEIKDNLIQACYPYGSRKVDFDFGKSRILPGFIDIHTHGGYGFDITNPNQASFDLWRAKLLEEGVTSFLATTLTDTKESLKKQLSFLTVQPEHKENGASLLGIHMEGPFLSSAYKGAQPKESLLAPDLKLFDHWQKLCADKIRIMTIAPELDGALNLIRKLHERNIVISLGHSQASYDQAVLAIANGADSATHTFNAMGFHHRDAQLANAILSIPSLYAELICDGLHVHPSAIRLFFACKKEDHAILVSDSLMLKGKEQGSSGNFSGQKIGMDPSGKIVLENGTLAGSSLKLNEALKYLIEDCQIRPVEAINALTKNPAALLGLKDKGSIQAGKEADLVILNKAYQIEAIIRQGKLMRFKGESYGD